MHPYRLIPRVLMQAQYLKNKPLVQAVNEFSSYASQLFLHHLFDDDEEHTSQLLIALSSIYLYRNIQSSMFHAIPIHCKHVSDINRMLDNFQNSLFEEYGNADLQREHLYQTHYLNVYMFCQYLMYKALDNHLKEDFQNILETELQAFVVKEFGRVPWTWSEMFSWIVMMMALLLVMVSALVLIPSITQWVASQCAIEMVSVIVSGIGGLFVGGFLLAYNCSIRG